MRYVPDDYFKKAPFSSEKGAFAFLSYTCVECGQRSVTWEAFKEHRAGCGGKMSSHFATAASGLTDWVEETGGDRLGLLTPEDVETLTGLLHDADEAA